MLGLLPYGNRVKVNGVAIKRKGFWDVKYVFARSDLRAQYIVSM